MASASGVFRSVVGDLSPGISPPRLAAAIKMASVPTIGRKMRDWWGIMSWIRPSSASTSHSSAFCKRVGRTLRLPSQEDKEDRT